MNPQNSDIHFRDTGLPKGLESKIHAGSATTVSGECYVTAICNSNSSAGTLTFNNQSHMAAIQIPASACVPLSYPIHCTEFTTAETYVTVVYVPIG